MRIVLAEVREQAPGHELAFEKELVVLGRDPASCDVVFEQTAWPMVSRRHAELRLKHGRCLLVDANSSFGTFLNGQRVTQPTEVVTGARLQLGAGGPVLLVLRLEETTAPPARVSFETRVITSEGAEPQQQQPPPPRTGSYAAPLPTQGTPLATPSSAPPPPSRVSRPSGPAPATTQLAFLEYVGGMSSKPERVRLDRPSVLLGRDPSSAVPIKADAAVVSRRHAEIRRRDGEQFLLLDLGSFNGTLLNDQRIAAPSPLHDGDRIQLGLGGPVFRFVDPLHPPTAEAPEPLATPSGALVEAPDFQRTMVVRGTSAAARGEAATGDSGVQPQLLIERRFDQQKPHLTVGRAPENDIHLDGLQISNYHARFVRNGAGSVAVEDAGSTNGVYLNGARITGRSPVGAGDVVQIGPFVLKVDPAAGVAVFDTRAKTRLDVMGVTKVVPNRSGRGEIKLLDDVSLAIEPNEFVGLLGPSGAGKSTLMDALNGMRPATSGRVLINGLDLYQHPDSLKQAIGYVPQDDIIHRELTVYRTLYYVARLRLSRDVSTPEIDQIIGEVLDVTGLTERRDVPVSQLSGGQRKRVSIAVELITKPSVIFLDEPTSGLDPATEDKIMRLFRQIAESGRTVILTTHAMENVKLFDKIVVMMRGRLVFYGTPPEALTYLGAESFKELYDKLEAPVEGELRKAAGAPPPPDASEEQRRAFEARREEATERVAEEWKNRFRATEYYARYVAEPLGGLAGETRTIQTARRRASLTDTVRQWATLTRRYMEVFGRDRLNLLVLFGQAPLIALFTYLVMNAGDPRDFPFFLLALVSIWFGTSVAAREIVKERPVYGRERMVNLGLWPYVGSKLVVLVMIITAQCLLLFGTLKLLDLAGLFKLPGEWGGLPQLLTMVLTGLVGIAAGLLISAVVKTSEMATSLVPLLLIPQILFSGLVGVPQGMARAVGAVMPAVWSFDAMKRFSTLDTLRGEGSNREGPNKGKGLYKHTEQVNEENVNGANSSFEKYRQEANQQFEDYERQMREYQTQARTNPGLAAPPAPRLGPPPTVPAAVRVNDDLSDYVNFLHPWGGAGLDLLILGVMFILFVAATLIALRWQDIR